MQSEEKLIDAHIKIMMEDIWNPSEHGNFVESIIEGNQDLVKAALVNLFAGRDKEACALLKQNADEYCYSQCKAKIDNLIAERGIQALH